MADGTESYDAEGLLRSHNATFATFTRISSRTAGAIIVILILMAIFLL